MQVLSNPIEKLSKVKTEDEDVVEGRRGLMEPVGPVNILVKTTLGN